MTPSGRDPRVLWRDYKSSLVWEHLGVFQKDLESVSEEREFGVSVLNLMNRGQRDLKPLSVETNRILSERRAAGFYSAGEKLEVITKTCSRPSRAWISSVGLVLTAVIWRRVDSVFKSLLTKHFVSFSAKMAFIFRPAIILIPPSGFISSPLSSQTTREKKIWKRNKI